MSKKNKKFKFKDFQNRPFYAKLAIPIDIFQKIRALTFEAEGEISGFGRTKIIDDGLSNTGSVVKVTDLEIFKQECEPAHTSIKNEDLHQLYFNAAKNGDDPSMWNFWWHSHVNMDTGFSLEDDNTMKKLSSNDGMIVALCTNKSGDYDATIYKNGKQIMKRIELMILPEMTPEILEEAKRIIEEKVTFKHMRYSKSSTEPSEFGSRITSYFENDFDAEFEYPNFSAGYPPIANMSKKDREELEIYNEENNIPKRQPGWNVRP